MTILSKLSSSAGRNDEEMNKQLAESIIKGEKKSDIDELITLLENKNKEIRSDVIKVLYEIGEQKPTLVSPHIKVFAELLTSKNNRMAWGAMTALDAIAAINPDDVFAHIRIILDVAAGPSVIARDHAVGILIKSLASRKNGSKALIFLFEQLRTCPTNQLPMYAEQAWSSIPPKERKTFADILQSRIDEIDKDSKKKRILVILKKVA